MVRNWISILVIPMILHDATTSAFVSPRGVVETTELVAVGGGATTTTTTTATARTSLNASILNLDTASRLESVRSLAVAGRIPWKKLVITKVQAREIISIMRAETHTLDVVAVIILSVFLGKIGRFM
jgi:hypothetical protein